MSLPTADARKTDINKLWQEAYSQASNEGQVPPETVVLGIDIGGTNLSWSLHKVTEGVVDEDALAEGAVPTPKGIPGLAEGYAEVLKAAMEEAHERACVITGVGVGSPGRFISKERYDAVGYEAAEVPRTTLTSVGLLSMPLQTPKGAGWKAGTETIIANGSALNLGEKREPQFDGVSLETLLRNLTPSGLEVKVKNDAGVQMIGLTEAVRKMESEKVTGKKIVYMGPGTGFGGAVMNAEGKLVTDGHYQFMKLGKRVSKDPNDGIVYDTIAEHNHANYEKHRCTDAIYPEDILSGTGIGVVLEKIYGAGMTSEKFDKEIYPFPSDEKQQQAVAQLKSIGRYYGEVMAKLYQGDFTHMDPKAEWPQADKQAIAGFETIVFGGGTSKARFFSDVILPAAEEVLAEKGLAKKIDFVIPEHSRGAAQYAAAAMLSEATRNIRPKNLQELNRTLSRQKDGV
jgi:glucokinase